MNIYISIILKVIYITYPLLLYLFYIAYNKNYLKEQNNLFLDISILSSFYLINRFSEPIFYNIPCVLVNTQIILAYLKNRKKLIFILSFIYIIKYFYYDNLNIILLIVEYISYFILYYLLCKKNKLKEEFINYFLLIKSIFFMLNIIISSNITTLVISNTIISLIILYLISYFTIFLFEKGEEIIRYHMSIKELEKEKQIRTSLFKITHEIKNPIAVCKGYLDMFDTSNPEHSIRYIPILKEEVERVLLILQDFLSLTKANIVKESMDIYMLLDDIVDDFKAILKNKNILLNVDIPDDELYIEGDYNKLKQVFINILKNSVEAIEEKNVDGLIKIKTNIINDKLIINISDNGIGMTDEILEKINEPFFTTKAGGTGLGTSLSYEIIKAHNGEIKYSSKKNNGTNVKITLNLIKNM